MAAYKKNNKYYIKGSIKKGDGTYYSYTKKAPVNSIKEAREYEIEFIKKYQDIEVSKKQLTTLYSKPWRFYLTTLCRNRTSSSDFGNLSFC